MNVQLMPFYHIYVRHVQVQDINLANEMMNVTVKQININKNVLNDYQIYWKRSQHIHGSKNYYFNSQPNFGKVYENRV